LMFFFLVAPSIDYPLRMEQAIPILSSILPVFAGYLGAATHYVFRHSPPKIKFNVHNEEILGMLVKGPIVIFGVAMTGLLVSFYFGARGEIGNRAAMSVDTLRMGVAIALTLQSGVTGALVMYLFSTGEKASV
jgi:hypothetical protein